MVDHVFPPSETVCTDTSAGLHAACDHCGAPIDLSSRRKIRQRRFCSDRCRTQWHREHREALQAEAADLLQRTLAIIKALAGPRR
jgi:endogenous inhibitor of DNA gyrase (YacG/DUF329 family)